mmetsp:Transcript_26765/g.61966  ORF Transcript_26765/g.61966 Transcript_26765/m.61966 type:complete len:171 (-) Transcript_26765:222-734(-)
MFFFEEKILICSIKSQKKAFPEKKKLKARQLFFEKERKNLTFGNFFSIKKKQKNEIFQLFFEKTKFKSKIFYFSGNDYKFKNFFKSFHFMENFMTICEMLFLDQNQFFFHHKNENLLSKFVIKMLSDLKFNSFGWLIEYRDFLRLFFNKNHNEGKSFRPDFVKKKKYHFD